MIKLQGGVLAPLDELESEELKSLKNGEQYEIEIIRTRNPAFHRKVFAFLNSVLTIGLQIKQNGNTLMSASNLTPFVNI